MKKTTTKNHSGAHPSHSARPATAQKLNFNFKICVVYFIIIVMLCASVGCAAPAPAAAPAAAPVPFAVHNIEPAESPVPYAVGDEAEAEAEADEPEKAKFSGLLTPAERDQWIVGERIRMDTIYHEGRKFVDTTETAEALADYLRTNYMPITPIDENMVHGAFIPAEHDFDAIDPELPIWIYSDLPQNLFCGFTQKFRTNAETIEDIGLSAVADYAHIASYIELCDFTRGQNISGWLGYFTGDHLTDKCKDELISNNKIDLQNNPDVIQDVVTTTDYTLVYTAGDGKLRARVLVESRDHSDMQWFYNIDDVILYVDETGAVDHTIRVALTDLYEITDPARIAFLNEQF